MRMRANYILVDPEPWTEQKLGTLVLPDGAKNKFARGVVEAKGPGLFLPNGDQPPIEVEVGDHVLYFKAAAVPLIFEGKDVHIVQEREILAILEPGDFGNIGD